MVEDVDYAENKSVDVCRSLVKEWIRWREEANSGKEIPWFVAEFALDHQSMYKWKDVKS